MGSSQSCTNIKQCILNQCYNNETILDEGLCKENKEKNQTFIRVTNTNVILNKSVMKNKTYSYNFNQFYKNNEKLYEKVNTNESLDDYSIYRIYEYENENEKYQNRSQLNDKSDMKDKNNLLSDTSLMINSNYKVSSENLNSLRKVFSSKDMLNKSISFIEKNKTGLVRGKTEVRSKKIYSEIDNISDIINRIYDIYEIKEVSI